MVLSSKWGRIQLEIQIWPDKVVAGSRKPLEVSRDALRAEITYDPLVAHSAIQNTAKVWGAPWGKFGWNWTNYRTKQWWCSHQMQWDKAGQWFSSTEKIAACILSLTRALQGKVGCVGLKIRTPLHSSTHWYLYHFRWEPTNSYIISSKGGRVVVSIVLLFLFQMLLSILETH